MNLCIFTSIGHAGDFKKIPVAFVFIFLFSFSYAQDTIDNAIEQKLEDIAESSNATDADYTALVEQLNFFREHPIDLNNTTREELLDLGLLTEIQVTSLLDHIEKNGKLLNVYELQSVEGYDIQIIKKILPYIKVSDLPVSAGSSLGEMFGLGKHTITLRASQVLEQQKGFSPVDPNTLDRSPDSRFIGSPQKIFARYRFNYGSNISWGITGEKDAGELFFADRQCFHSPRYDSLVKGKVKTGFDFYSAHFFVRNIKFIRALAIGDYALGFGQGLVCWSSLAYTKGADAMNIKKYASGLRPYTSVDENRFFRGAALSARYKQLELTGFFSRKKRDANIISFDTLNNEALAISALQLTGLHTTPSELADRHVLQETIMGGNLSYKTRKIQLGITGMNILLGADYNRSLSLYNQFTFASRQLTSLSADYNIVFRNFNFFGEEAVSITPQQSGSGGKAMINGVLVAPDQRFSIAVMHRYFEKNYRSLFANAFAEGTEPANEQGIYIGTTIKPTDFIILNAFYDRFVFPWLRYQVNAPSQGSDWMAQINYTPFKNIEMYFKVRQRDKFTDFNSPDRLDYLVPTRQINYRYHISYSFSHSFMLRNRIEYLAWTDGTKSEKGYMIYQDIIYRLPKIPITLTGRYALFDTDSYNSRIYVYETEVPGAYAIPTYYYRGSRAYLMINYDMGSKIEFWVRCGQTFYSNQNIISAGSLSEIDGNTKTEVTAQVRIYF